MSEITFPELAEKIQQHFEQQTYTEGLTLASEHFTRFPEEFTTINYWRICLAARLGQYRPGQQIPRDHPGLRHLAGRVPAAPVSLTDRHPGE